MTALLIALALGLLCVGIAEIWRALQTPMLEDNSWLT